MEAFDITEIALINASKTRFFVVEQSVMIEEFLSFTMCKLLGIDETKSKSFGYGTNALGFNQKITLVQDKQDIPPEIKQKFDVLMQIRNKFAHFKSIDSFDKFFKIPKYVEVKKKLEKWYSKNDEKYDNIEIQYKTYYHQLTNELFYYLFNLILVHEKHDVQNDLNQKWNEKFLELLEEKIASASITSDIWNETKNETLAVLKINENSA